MNADSSMIERLRGENELLRKQLAGVNRTHQEMLLLSHRLDQEKRRLSALQRFIEKAVHAQSAAEFAVIACESLIDVLECGAGILWCLQAGQEGECFYQAGMEAAGPPEKEAMADWVGRILEWRGSNAGGPPPPPSLLGFDDRYLAELVVDNMGLPLCVVFACNTAFHADFTQGFGQSEEQMFSTFARQVGVLIVSLKHRATINSQIETIRVSESRLSTALVSSNVGLWDWDFVTNTIYYSDQWKSQLGLMPDEVGDSPEEWIIRLHPEEREEALRVVWRCVSQPGSGYEMTLRMKHRGGHWVWINTRGFNISDPSAHTTRLIGTHIDVSEYKNLERKLMNAEKKQRLAREQAERESRAKSSFLASVSHEFRTPLNGILAAFQMLGITRDEEERRRLVSMGEKAGRWMLKILGESLDITRIEAGKMELRPETVNLPLLLAEIRAEWEYQAASGVEFRWHEPEAVPRFVRMDPVRFRQVITNLISNALKFTRTGHVSVSFAFSPAERRRKARLRCEVRDSGIGFSPEFRKVMFQPFTQELEKSQSSERGIGLGLVITRELVSLMGGCIKVRSEQGVGSSFEVTIPLEAAEPPQAVEECAPEVRLPLFDGRVLLVEDDPISAELAAMMLRRLGVEVEQAGDGAVALEMACGGGFDLVVMDCWMPVMDGLEATRRLRAFEDSKVNALPVVALTANAAGEDVERCIAAGMNGVMIKPLLLEQLIERISPYLRSRTENC